MCAIEAGRRGRRVVVLERAERIGKKILISGVGAVTLPISLPAGELPFRESAFLQVSAARYTRRTLSLWWRNMASPTTRRRWAALL